MTSVQPNGKSPSAAVSSLDAQGDGSDDDDDDDDDEEEDDDSDQDDGEESKSHLKNEISAHQKSLEKLKREQPDFYAFMQANDPVRDSVPCLTLFDTIDHSFLLYHLDCYVMAWSFVSTPSTLAVVPCADDKIDLSPTGR